MTRALGPRASILDTNAGAAWLVLAACWSPIGALALMWASAKLAATAVGGAVAPFGADFALAIGRHQFQRAWPRTPTPLVVLVLMLLLTALISAAWMAWRRIARRFP